MSFREKLKEAAERGEPLETEETQTLQPAQEPLSNAPSAPITNEGGSTLPLTKTSAVTPGRFVDAFPPEIEEYKQAMMSEESEQPNFWKATAWAMASEIGGGVGGTAALMRSRWGLKGLEALKGLKNISKVGILAPEASSTLAGAGGLLLTEAGIWGLSNYVGQTIRIESGIQKEFSGGEALAAAVFGLTPIYTGVGKALKLPASPLSGVGFASREMVVNGTKVVVQGATIGIAETAMRQAVQIQLNEIENVNPYEFLLAGTIGGSANLGFQSLGAIWSRTGKWGKDQATSTVKRAKADLAKQKKTLNASLEARKAFEMGARLGSPFIAGSNETGKALLLKQIGQIEQAQELLDDSLRQIIKASEAAEKTKVDLMPSKITDETLEAPLPKPPKKDVSDDAPTAPKVKGFKTDTGDTPNDIDFLKAGGKLTVMSPDEYIDMAIKADPKRSRKDIVNERLEDVEGMARNKKALQNDAAPPLSIYRQADGTYDQEGLKRALAAKELGLTEVPVIVDASRFKADAPTPPKTPTKEPTQQPEGDEIDALIKRFEKVGKDNMTLELPDIAEAANVISNKHNEGLEDGIRLLAKKGNENDIATLESLIIHARDLNRVESQVLDIAKTTFGRTGLKLRKDSDRFQFLEEYSKRSRESKSTLDQLENALQKRLDGAEAADLSRLIDDYTKINKRNKKADSKATRQASKTREKELETLTPEQLAKKETKVIKQLEGELEKLRKRFGDDAKIKTTDVPKKAEASAKIKDLKDRINFHKANESDAIRLGERLKERERLLAVETGPLGTQRAEVAKKPTGQKKSSGKLEKINSDIAFLKNNMRNRVQEIDKAAKELTPEAKAQKVAQAHKKQIDRLDKELNEYRARFGDMDAVEARVAEADAKPKAEKPQDIKDKEEALRFHKEAEKEALAIVALEKDLAKTIDVEARGIMGDMRASTKAKPTEPKAPKKSDELRKKISESKARMRTRLKQIDKAREDIVTERELANIYNFYERTFYDSLNKNGALVGTVRWAQQARQLGLINQLVSVTAGVATNIVAVIKQFSKGGLASVPVIGRIKGTEIASPTFIADKLFNKMPMSVARANARADAYGAWMMLKDMDGIFKAMKRTFVENVGATTGQGGKFSDEVSQSALPRGMHALVARAHGKAERRAKAIENVGNTVSRMIEVKDFQSFISVFGRLWLTMLSPGVRGIQALDEGFRRQIIKGQIWSSATKSAIGDQLDPLTGRVVDDFDAVKAEQHTLREYNAAWKDSDGLAVLKAQHKYQNEVNNVGEELLFAANGQKLSDVAEPLSDKAARSISNFLDNNWHESTALIGALLKTWQPYVGVPTRAVWRGLHYSVESAWMPFSRIPGLQFGKYGVYNKQIKKYELKIKSHEEALRTEQNLTKTQKAEITREIQELQERLDVSVVRRATQNREDLTDMLMGYGLLAYGMYLAKEGGQGSLDHLSKEQRRDSKLKPFTLRLPDWLGGGEIDYKTAMPWSLPIAIGVNVQQWRALREEQTLTGAKLLKKDFFSMLGSTFITLNLEQPFVQGLKQGKETIQGIAAEDDSYEKEKGNQAMANTISSFVSIIFPVQAKKIIERITTKGVPDFRGGSFQDRLVYGMFGVGPANIRTDRLGEPMADNKTWFTQNVWRLFPKGSKEASEFEKVETGTSLFGVLSDKPTQLKSTGVKMVDWADEDNFSLSSTFDAQLRKQKLSQKVEKLVSSSGFQRGLGKWTPEKDKYVNPSMTRLNDLLLEEWGKAGDTLLQNKKLLKRFVNKEDVNLYDHLREREKTSVKPIQVPLLQELIKNK